MSWIDDEVPPPAPGGLPLIIFDGNCQAQHLAAIVDAGGLAEAWVNGSDFGTVPSYRGQLANFADEVSCLRFVQQAKVEGRRTIQATQSTPWSDATSTSYSHLVDDVIRFPYLHCDLYLRSSDPARASTSNFKRIYEADLDVIRLCQTYAQARFDFAGFIEREHRVRPLFHMHVHPGPELMSALLREIGQKIGSDEGAVDVLAQAVAAGEGINVFTQHPIGERIRSEVGFGWPESYGAYGAMIDAIRRSDWRSLLEKRQTNEALFSRETLFWSGLFGAGLATRSDAVVAESFARISFMAPGLPEFWAMMHEYDRPGRPALADRAMSVFRGQRQLYNVLSRFASQDGNHEAAIRYGKWFLDDAADLADGVFPLALAYLGAGRPEDAGSVVRDFLLSHEEARQHEVKLAVKSHAQLGALLPH